ncbi:MAG: Na/Pi symporter [Fidelibacterota bacterium]|nr:MAG: Na/Pi symporter [Candidatus Neomarinimicrobiota bacterium]
MSRDQLKVLLKLVGLLAFLYLFIVGIGAMGHSFKLFGREFSERILNTTASPLVGLFIGILATSLVQSSSTTTSIVVGMVAGGAISIQGAIPIVMGANIGTTVTNTIVSIGHITRKTEFRRAFAAAIVHDFFNIVAVAVLFPLELATGFLSRSAARLAILFEGIGGMTLGSPLKAATVPAIAFLADLVGQRPVLLLILAVLLIFAMLAGIVKVLRSLVLKRISAFFDEHLFKTAARAFLFGVLLTGLVQSSSITTSLAVPLVGAGLLSLLQIFPYTLGANVGTTVTAILAALSTANMAAITVSFAHLLFNISGIVLIWPIKKVRRLPILMAEFAAATAIKNRFLPLLFILFVFFIIPLIFIVTTR